MKLSIILPVYNVEKYLKKCIDSIRNQSYTDFELILVDDGSQDGSSKICDIYAKIDKRIKVIHQNNAGVSAARNVGIENAHGKYIIFVDSDDYLEPTYCEELYNQIELYPDSWCFCGCNIVDANSIIKEKNCVYHQTPVYEFFNMDEYNNIYKTNYSALLWIRIFNTKIIKDHNIRFDENLSLSEDVLFNLQYGRYCNSFAIINLPLYNHRMYYNNECEHLDGKKIKNSFYLNQKLYSAREYFIKNSDVKNFNTDFLYRFIDDIKLVANNEEYKIKEKINRISEVIKSKEFVKAMSKADTSKENWKLLLALKIKVSLICLFLFRR